MGIAIEVLLIVGLLLVMALEVSGHTRAPKKTSPFYASNTVDGVVFSGIVATAADVQNVTVQLTNSNFEPIAQIGIVDVYLSDNADGSTLTSQAADSIAIVTKGVILGVITTAKAVKVASNTSGIFDLAVTIAAGRTYYMVICLPDGTIQVSGAIVIT